MRMLHLHDTTALPGVHGRDTTCGLQLESPSEYTRFELGYENFPEAVLTVEHDRGKAVNHAFERLFQLSRADVEGLPLGHILDQLSFTRDQAAAVLRPVPPDGDDLELVRTRPTHAPQTLRVRRFHIHDTGLNARQALIFMDETFRHQAWSDNEVLSDQVLRTNRQAALSEMVIALAHEIRQPLGAIVNFAGAACRTLNGHSPPVEELENLLTHIRAQALRAGDVLKSLDSFLRGAPHTATDACINTCLSVVLSFAEPTVREHEIRLSLELAPDLPCVPGDQIIVQQIILNLVTNAIQALSTQPDHQRHLHIATMRDSDYGIRIDVRDTGPGLPPHLGERIFEPFITTKKSGSGLGLPIARALTSRLGGTLDARPASSGGSCFTLRLPGHRDTSMPPSDFPAITQDHAFF